MVDLIEGPLVWIALCIFVLGLLFEGRQFLGMTRKKVWVYPPLPSLPKKEEKRWDRWIRSRLAPLRGTLWRTDPVLTVATTVFHVCAVLTPLFLLGHNLLWQQAIGVSLWSLPEIITDGLALIVLIGVVFFVGRRLLVRRVRAIATGYDYVMLGIVAAPFATGFFAYHQIFDYRTVMTLHLLSGEILLIALPFTKLAHMLFFFLYRFWIGSEYSFTRGTRTWWFEGGQGKESQMDEETKPVDTETIAEMLKEKKGRMKRYLSHCVHCSLCAESCFLYMAHDKDPQYMPSYKVVQSLGRLYKKRGKVDRRFLMEIKGIVWNHCVLCGRCYCPIGVHVPSMITFVRSICRSQGVYPDTEEGRVESWL